jgi:hypothetical protein
MPDLQQSTQSNLLIRDITDGFNMLVAQSPTLISYIRTGSKATSSKVEWMERVLTPTMTTITAFVTDGNGVGITVASVDGLRAGSVLRFETATGATVTEQVQIASISGNTLTVTRTYGGTTAQTLVVGNVVKLVSRPRPEMGTVDVYGGAVDPTFEYNYLQRFEQPIVLSNRLADVKKYGYSSTEDYINDQLDVKSKALLFQLNETLIHGRRVENTLTVNGSMGGILQYVSGGNVEATGGAISEAHINNLAEKIFSKGGVGGNYVLVGNPTQTRKISKFNNAVNNVTRTTTTGDNTYRSMVDTFVTDLQGRGNMTFTIVPENSFPKDTVGLFNLDEIEFAYFRGVEYVDRANKDFNGIATAIETEVSLRVRNGKQSHGVVTGLTI